MDEKFLLKEAHKIYNYADEPSVERRIYWLFKGDEKRDLVVEVEKHTYNLIYKFFIEDEESSDHYLIKNMKQIIGVSSTKRIDEEKLIRRILNSSKIGTSIKEQYLKEVDEEIYLWIENIEGLDLFDFKYNLV